MIFVLLLKNHSIYKNHVVDHVNHIASACSLCKSPVNYQLQIYVYEKSMLMHVYRLNFFTHNIDKYNQGQGH